MNVKVRRAEERDVPAMLALVKELAEFEREPHSVEVTEEEMRDAGFGKTPLWIGWVAERRSEAGVPSIVGIAVCYERYSTWKGRCLYLEDIVVTAAARGLGIGDRLLKACAGYAVQQGHHHMLWQVLDWNVDAIRFYQRYGAEIGREWLNGRLYRQQLQKIIDT